MALGPGSGYYWPSLEGAMLRLEKCPRCGQCGLPGALLLREIPLMALDRGAVARTVKYSTVHCTTRNIKARTNHDLITFKTGFSCITYQNKHKNGW